MNVRVIGNYNGINVSRYSVVDCRMLIKFDNRISYLL